MPFTSSGTLTSRRLRLCIVWAGLVMLLVLSSARAAPEDDLLAFLVEQNSAAQGKLRSYSYTIKVQWNNDSDKTAPLQGEGQVKRDGQCRWSIYRKAGFNTTAGKLEDRETRLVVNDKYAAFLPAARNPYAYQVFHSSIETMDQRIRTRTVMEAPMEVLSYCFSDRTTNSFRETMAKFPTWKFDAISVKGADGKTVYQIRRFMPTSDNASKPEAVYVLDPEQGFLVIENISYKDNGDEWFHRHIEAKQVAPNVWFPVSFKELRYGDFRDPPGTKSVTSWHQAQLTDIVVNPQFPKEQFEISALRLQENLPNIVVIRTDLDGKNTLYGYLGSNLVPLKLKAQANDKQAIDRRTEAMGGIESGAAPATQPTSRPAAPASQPAAIVPLTTNLTMDDVILGIKTRSQTLSSLTMKMSCSGYWHKQSEQSSDGNLSSLPDPIPLKVSYDFQVKGQKIRMERTSWEVGSDTPSEIAHYTWDGQRCLTYSDFLKGSEKVGGIIRPVPSSPW